MSARRKGTGAPVDWEAVRARLSAARGALADDETPERIRALLDERARRLAVPPVRADREGEGLQVVTFALGPETYAVEATFVREVVRLVSVTPVPGTPAHVLGVVNLRGEILMVADLRKLLGLERPGITDLSRVIVLGAGRAELGLVADATHELRTIPRSSLREPPAAGGGADAHLLLGVTPEALVLLDGRALLGDARLHLGAERRLQPDKGVGT